MQLDFSLKQNSKSESGFTLIELLVAGALTGILALVIIQTSNMALNGALRSKLLSTRDQIIATTRLNAGRTKVLATSLAKVENIKFHDCVCGGGSPCNSMEVNPITLFETPTSKAINPAYYNSSGLPCKKEEKDCYIQITTSFLSQCAPVLPNSNPVPPATCTTPAEFTLIKYEIQQNPATLAKGNFLKLIQGSVFTDVSDIAPTGSGVCP
jgi:prepilin-type N-terminal cleavage/methylation domain-containing protein